ncbi:helix-turn-helix transcriptional regulator [Cellulosimicrobium funkei]|uniref:helix-turn-helix transcriptional regulator n=1 Tax=Cellulosimicrobium funkei TaxID=264251 RepID=UPI00367ACD3C
MTALAPSGSSTGALLEPLTGSGAVDGRPWSSYADHGREHAGHNLLHPSVCKSTFVCDEHETTVDSIQARADAAIARSATAAVRQRPRAGLVTPASTQTEHSKDLRAEARRLIPVVDGSTIARPQLESVLDGEAKFVLVRALSGFGKTASTARWAMEQLSDGALVVWISAATIRGERASELLLSYVVGELRRLAQFVSPPADIALDGPLATQLDRLVNMVFAATIVVDDVDSDNVELIDAAQRIAACTSVRLIVLSRVRRPRAIAAPKGGVEVTADALAWSTDETHAFARSLGQPLSDLFARKVADGLMGWPQGIVACLRDVSQEPGGVNMVSDHFEAMVRRHRTRALSIAFAPEAVSVLLDVCLERSFDEPRLLELSSLPDASRIARDLVEAGMLYTHPGVGEPVFEMMPRLRRMLLDHLWYLSPEDFSARMGEVARRYLSRGEAWTALARGVEARNPGLIDEVLPAVWDQMLDGREGLSFEQTWDLVFSADPESVPGSLRLLRTVLHSPIGGTALAGTDWLLGDRTGDAPSGTERPADLLDAFCRSAALRRAGRPDLALRLARESLTVDSGVPVSMVARALVELQAGLSALYSGMLRSAAGYAVSSYQHAMATGALRIAAAAGELSAVIEACSSDTRAAERWMAQVGDLPDVPAWWRRCIGDVRTSVETLAAVERLDAESARVAIESDFGSRDGDLWFVVEHARCLLAELDQSPEMAIDVLTHAVGKRGLRLDGAATDRRPPLLLVQDLASLQLAAGRGAAAQQAMEAMPSGVPLGHILQGVLDASDSRPADALRHVTLVSEQPRSVVGVRLAGLVVAGNALLGLGQTDHAREELMRAVTLASEVGAFFAFRWAAPAALALIADRIEKHEALARVERFTGSRRPQMELVRLPERQLMVLQCLVRGLSAPQVARELHVSSNTVKTQIREIYRRLGVHTRVEALARAKQLGIASGQLPREDRRLGRAG